MAAEPDDMRPVASRAELDEEGRLVVTEDGQAIALFYHEGEVYAVDNRCPHMGFPLTRGTLDDGVLTCHWHHARFELEAGDTFDPWADDVQTFPVEIRDDEVYLDPDPPRKLPPNVHWRNRLADGLHENLSLVMAKAVVGLDDAGEGFHTPIETAVDFGTKYRSAGWGRGLTTLGCTANLYSQVGGRDRRRAMFAGVREVADDCAGEPPRFQQYAFDNRDLSKDRLKSWFRESVEVRDDDGAERCLLTAVACLDPEAVAEIVFTAATDSLYLNGGHTVDFLNKAFTTLDHVGWHGDGEESNAAKVLAATVDQLTDATRSEELSSWRTPIDVAELVFDVHERLPDLVAAGDGKEWSEPEEFVDELLVDDPEHVVDALTGAIREGASQTELADAVARAATRRVAWFATNNEFADWNTVHHTFSYANAVFEATQRTDATALYRGCFDAAISVYLDRFLNSPRAPLPTPGDSDRDPADVREDVLACFDEQGQVNRAAAFVSEHFDAGGDVDDLKRVLGRGLLREDAGFHTIQNVEGHFARHDAADDEWEQRLALMAAARYMAAHFPTRRSNEQTFSIATRLHRGEKLHEAE
ncbi:Rieske (2Fe-2S) protein [Halobacterium wangiae]|uniref:Rieske (2Fe-2S) protein n=1 Tax=Halobacterium wangiae TaxID=2902623 RepID=UPI001E55D3CA|nr:Rieske (2Fe-2S) protein [Halobacterium wangiae]